MPSKYVLIEQTELHDFLHDLEALYSWARKMAGLGTPITAPAALGAPVVRSERHPYARPMPLYPFASPSATTYPSNSPIFPPSPQAQPSRRNKKQKHHSYEIGQSNRDVGLAEFGPFPGGTSPPPLRMPGRDGSMWSSHINRQGCEPRERPIWQAPVKYGPHRTPNVTRAPSVPHTPQRGLRYVRRPRRVRAERNAGNAEAIVEDAEDTKDDEYVVEEDDDADVNEQEGH